MGQHTLFPRDFVSEVLSRSDLGQRVHRAVCSKKGTSLSLKQSGLLFLAKIWQKAKKRIRSK